LLFRVFKSPDFAYHVYLDVAGILKLILDALDDFFGHQHTARVVDILGLNDDAYLAACLNGKGFLDALERIGNFLKLLQPLDIMLDRFAPCAGPRAADGVAAWTSTASIVFASMSPWWARMQWITAGDSLYFFARSPPMVMCVPSTSWSTDLPMSCKRPARLHRATSAPSSLAIRPARWDT
jgi:hypothetical protein